MSPVQRLFAQISGVCLALSLILPAMAQNSTPSWNLPARSKIKADSPDAPWQTIEVAQTWPAAKTALIICDMWDDHWCKSAARRVGELVGPMNEMAKTARARGSLVIHAPSSVVAFYNDHPARKRALAAPFSPTPAPLATADRWGTKWCWPDAQREPDMPVDDSDMGCDCPVKCEIREAWTRQHPGIEILDQDAITDNGQETWNLLRERGIEHVMIAGVHLNMCVLGRPFAIRQLVHLGVPVVLVRDMTDTMYDPRMRPFVPHFQGTRLVVEHVEKYWCPTITSSVLTGVAPFKFKGQ